MASCHACQRVAILAGSAILMVAILAFEWGSLGAPRESILAGTSLKAAQLEHVKGVSMQVSTISLAEVLELSRYAEAGPRMMKMDIEGAEFEVLRQLLSKRLLCKSIVDLLTIEWHDSFFTKGAHCKTCWDVRTLVHNQRPTETCSPTAFSDYDDESYLHDGQPWPPVSEDVKAMFSAVNGSTAASADMFKGCRAIFYDVGANIGTHVRKLFEPEKYEEAGYLALFDKVFGDRSHRGKSSTQTGLCAFVFEANPHHAPRLAELEATYNAAGWRVKVFAPAVVSTSTGEVKELYMNEGAGGADKEEWGASIVEWRPW